jgi:hypothetical protein
MRRAERRVIVRLLAAVVVAASSANAQSPAPIAPISPPPARSAPRAELLQSGRMVTLRVRQVIPRDGLTPGERLLHGLPALVEGDRILAEVMVRAPSLTLVGGTVAHITPPGHFSKPGHVTLELGQLVTDPAGRGGIAPWAFDLEDRRQSEQRRRRLLLALFAAEGLGIGASIGSQVGGNSPTFIGGGAGLGLLSGIGYASLMPGQEATLEPGDTFRVQVGTLSYRPIPASPPLKLYPAPDPSRKKRGHQP